MLYLLRHGAIEWPEADCFIGQTDAPLSTAGRLQAQYWRNKFHSMASPAVWSSDLRRATETAEIIFAGRAAPIRTCRGLREIQLGEWEGVPRRRVRQSCPDLWLARGNDLADYKPPGGESFRDVQKRVVPQVIKIAEETPDAAFIVTHAGVIRVLVGHFLQMPLANLFRIRLDYASLSIVSYSPGHSEIHSLNLRPLNPSYTPGGEIGGKHDPVKV
jgi:probable phosphoglycerate mutase